MTTLLQAVKAAGEDFEWYPTTDRMIALVLRHIPVDAGSIMDIGAGDGRVLAAFAQKAQNAELFAIEKSHILIQTQPERITPVGCDFHQQNLSALPCDYIFSNPPYREYVDWVLRIIETGFANKAFVVIPQRWKDEPAIVAALAKRGATARVIGNDDFMDAERKSRAVVDIVEISFPKDNDYWNSKPVDPFDQWFDQNITTFEEEKIAVDENGWTSTELARVRSLKTILELVESFNEDYTRMEDNYRKIFTLDFALLKELGVKKDEVRKGIKARMAGLKATYWKLLFDHLDVVTNRLSTATKKKFLDRLTGRTAVAFTYDNAFAIVMWAIKHANKYFDEQLVDLFKQLATFEGVSNYKSNQKTWEKSNWRYNVEDHSHFALDYRIVVTRYAAIFKEGNFDSYKYPGKLHEDCHHIIADMTAVFANLGFMLDPNQPGSMSRQWVSNSWQDFVMADGRTLFQVKGFLNGNVHVRILPEAIRALNIEAGRLLGWINTPADAVREMGVTMEEAEARFRSNRQLTASNLKQLTASNEAAA